MSIRNRKVWISLILFRLQSTLGGVQDWWNLFHTWCLSFALITKTPSKTAFRLYKEQSVDHANSKMQRFGLSNWTPTPRRWDQITRTRGVRKCEALSLLHRLHRSLANRSSPLTGTSPGGAIGAISALSSSGGLCPQTAFEGSFEIILWRTEYRVCASNLWYPVYSPRPQGTPSVF